ncbi:hypothetical protein B0O99DRAFT_592045 [Bisporella sp. PMI_857]|nr:hypothetical protein B0O99DRAFT_592045 [Bisporella sp. PMI_857]
MPSQLVINGAGLLLHYNLTPMNTTSVSGDFPIGSAEAFLYGAAPILTLFYPGNGSPITQAESQLTCMKTLGTGVEGNKPQSSTDEIKKRAGSTFGSNMAMLTVPFWLMAL